MMIRVDINRLFPETGDMKQKVKTRDLLKTLTDTRDLLEVGWCQGYLATTEDHESCLPSSVRAVRFCLTGAVMRTARSGALQLAVLKAVQAVLPKKYRSSNSILDEGVVEWNDAKSRNKKQVVQKLNEAIEQVRFFGLAGSWSTPGGRHAGR